MDPVKSTLLAEMWRTTDADTDDAANAQAMRVRLAAGELIPTGNCRDVDKNTFWVADEEK